MSVMPIKLCVYRDLKGATGSDCLPQERHEKENTRQKMLICESSLHLKKAQMEDIYKLSEIKCLVSLILDLNMSSRITDFEK